MGIGHRALQVSDKVLIAHPNIDQCRRKFCLYSIKLNIILPIIYLKLKAASAKQPQPTIKAIPPSGVIAPSHLMSVKLSAYKLPENMIVPTIKAHPATAKKVGDS